VACAGRTAAREAPGDPPARAPPAAAPAVAAPGALVAAPAGRRAKPGAATYLAALLVGCPEVAAAATLAHDFLALLRIRDPAALDPWLARAAGGTVPEFRELAAGLVQDHAAVDAALRLEWSNGPVEGHVNKLKLAKRAMYGRAGFPLLRRRVLRAA
jgi:transposase